MVSGIEASSARWSGFVEKSVAGSVHAAEMPFVDSGINTGSISGSGLTTPGIGAVAFRGKSGEANEIPDEVRVNRGDKRGRIVNVTPGRAAQGLQRRLDPRAHLDDPAPGDRRRTSRWPSPSRPSRARKSRSPTAFYAQGREEAGPARSRRRSLALVNNDKPDVLATAYAPAEPDYAKASPFEALLQDEPESDGRFIPPVAPGRPCLDEQAAAGSRCFPGKEQICLANGIYFEARGESLRGQAAVAQVILNRVRNPTYPNSICGVVYQNDNWRNRCQFSFACDGRKDKITSPSHYKMAKDVAMAVTAGKIFIPEVGSSTHYYAQYVSPGWARAMKKMTKIGLHIFYRTYGRRLELSVSAPARGAGRAAGHVPVRPEWSAATRAPCGSGCRTWPSH